MSRRAAAGMLVAGALVIAGAVALSADTLVLRDGRRVTGSLISIRNGTIEFQERGGYANRTIRISRDEVRRIEFDDDVPGDYPGRGAGMGRGGQAGGGASGRPAGMQVRQMSVSAASAWTDTGIDVRDGQMVYFEARGEVAWAPGQRGGPQGLTSYQDNPNRPMPGRPAGALIARVGNDMRDAFYVGDVREAFRIRGTGRLFLGINDDYLQDNRGAWTVTVYY